MSTPLTAKGNAAMKLQPNTRSDRSSSPTFDFKREPESPGISDPIKHSPPSERHAQEKLSIIKKEPIESSSCQTEVTAPLSKEWVPGPYFSSGNVPTTSCPGLIRSEDNSHRSPTNFLNNPVLSSTTGIVSMTESYSRGMTSDPTTDPKNYPKQSRKRKSKNASATKFLPEGPFAPKQRISWSNEAQRRTDEIIEQRSREWKAKQAIWRSAGISSFDPGYNLSPRFITPRNPAEIIPYSYEPSRYPILSEENFYYASGTGNYETIGQSSRSDVSITPSSSLIHRQRETNELAPNFEAPEPVIKDVVSLAETQLQSEAMASVGQRRMKRTRKNLDESRHSFDKQESSESGTSENDESLNSGKYISDLAQPFINIPDDHQVAHINGLLSLPSNRETRYGITYGELKRRCNSPESLTRVDLVAYVRHSKSSGRNLLDKYRIVSANRNSKPNVLSKMCENEARVLGDGILKMNMDFFPGKVLAQTATSRVKDQMRRTSELASTEGNEQTKNVIKEKMHEIEITRSMLKEIYDLLLSEKDSEDMKQFELASHTFGTANLMNHLTLFDRFFEDYKTCLSSKKT